MRFAVMALTFALVTSSSVAQIPNLGINASLNGKVVLPVDNPWNLDISGLPVDSASNAILSAVGMGLRLSLGSNDTSGAPISYIVVPGNQTRVNVEFDNGGQSDRGLYPIPFEAPIEGGPDSTGDRHVIVVDRDSWVLYELFRAFPKVGTANWWAVQGSIFDLNSNAVRPAGWTSADAAGLPIFPGLIRYDEVWETGEINHALRVTVPTTSRGYIFPARHFASKSQDKNLPPMGLRVRLKQSVDISGFPYEAQVILRALKKYGMFVADNAPRRPKWELICTADPRWNDAALQTLHSLTGADLEVVQRGIVEPVFDSLKLDVASITGGLSTNATVNLNGPVPPGGLAVYVDSDNPAVQPVVSNLFIPEGATSARVTLLTRPVLNGVNTFVRVSTLGYMQSAKLALEPVTVRTFSVSPSNALGGTISTATVTLKAPAGPGAITIGISSNCAAARPLNSTLTIPEGSVTGTVAIQTWPVDVKTMAALTATVSGRAISTSLTIQPSVLASLTVSPTSGKGGLSRSGTVTLTGPAGPAGVVVKLRSTSVLVTVPAIVVVPAGQSNVNFTVPTSTVSSKTSATLTATLGTANRNATVSMTP